MAAVDPRSRRIVQLFDPRRHVWREHFRWHGARLIGKTPIGRATVRLLGINRSKAVEIRDYLIEAGVFVIEPARADDGVRDVSEFVVNL